MIIKKIPATSQDIVFDSADYPGIDALTLWYDGTSSTDVQYRLFRTSTSQSTNVITAGGTYVYESTGFTNNDSIGTTSTGVSIACPVLPYSSAGTTHYIRFRVPTGWDAAGGSNNYLLQGMAGGSASFPRIRFMYNSSNNYVMAVQSYVRLTSNSNTWVEYQYNSATYKALIKTNDWNDIVIVQSISGSTLTLTTYLNGTAIAHTNTPPQGTAGTIYSLFGHENSGTVTYGQAGGGITYGAFAVFQRALTASEVLALRTITSYSQFTTNYSTNKFSNPAYTLRDKIELWYENEDDKVIERITGTTALSGLTYNSSGCQISTTIAVVPGRYFMMSVVPNGTGQYVGDTNQSLGRSSNNNHYWSFVRDTSRYAVEVNMATSLRCFYWAAQCPNCQPVVYYHTVNFPPTVGVFGTSTYTQGITAGTYYFRNFIKFNAPITQDEYNYLYGSGTLKRYDQFQIDGGYAN